MRRPLALLLGVAVVWYGFAWLDRVPAGEPLLAIAHRGAPATTGAPEGTLASFRMAIEAGADALELDVRRTRDGVLVVLHDPTVDRTTDGSGAVSGLTLDEVRALDAGQRERIPTVGEVLVLARTADVALFAEIKDGPANPGMAGQLVDLLVAEDVLDQATIQAFEAETLVELAEIAPAARTCWLTRFGTFDLSTPPADVAAVCPAAETLLLHPGLIRQAHLAGRDVLAWWSTLETALGNEILAAYGVDGLILDDLGNRP